MQRTVILLVALSLLTAAAQTQLELRQLTPVLAEQPITLQLTIAQRGNTGTVIGGLLGNTVPCPLFKVYDRAGGPPLTERYLTSNCLPGKNVTFSPGQRRVYTVTLPMKLTPGQYTAVLTLRGRQSLSGQANVNVGPGPFVTELVLPHEAKAGQALDLQVAFRNVWRSAASQDLRLCGNGLLIRDDRGNTVYDNKPEEATCMADLEPTTVAAGGVHPEAWGKLPALKTGWYTAILWGYQGQAVKRFQVKP